MEYLSGPLGAHSDLLPVTPGTKKLVFINDTSFVLFVGVIIDTNGGIVLMPGRTDLCLCELMESGLPDQPKLMVTLTHFGEFYIRQRRAPPDTDIFYIGQHDDYSAMLNTVGTKAGTNDPHQQVPLIDWVVPNVAMAVISWTPRRRGPYHSGELPNRKRTLTCYCTPATAPLLGDQDFWNAVTYNMSMAHYNRASRNMQWPTSQPRNKSA